VRTRLGAYPKGAPERNKEKSSITFTSTLYFSNFFNIDALAKKAGVSVPNKPFQPDLPKLMFTGEG
jgi:hypothetical protein